MPLTYLAKQPHLAVIQLGRLGDMIQSTLALKALRQQNPAAHLSLIAFKPFVKVLAHWPVIDEVITLDQSEWSYLTEPNAWDIATYAPVVNAFAKKLNKFDRVYNLTFNELASYLAYSLAKPNQVTGFALDDVGNFVCAGDWGQYLTASLDFRLLNPFNLVDLFVLMVQGYPFSGTLHVSSSNIDQASTLLPANCDDTIMIALQCGASRNQRCWPLEQFASLANFLTDHPRVRLVFVGTEDEGPLVAQIILLMKDKQRAINLTGQTQLSQLADVIRQVCLVVGNDTGTMHLAAAVGTPTVTIFLDYAHFWETGPYGFDHLVLQAAPPQYPSQATIWGQSSSQISATAVAICISQLVPELQSLTISSPNNQLPCYRSRHLWGQLDYVPIDSGAGALDDALRLIYRWVWLSALCPPDQFTIPLDTLIETLPQSFILTAEIFAGLWQTRTKAQKVSRELERFQETVASCEQGGQSWVFTSLGISLPQPLGPILQEWEKDIQSKVRPITSFLLWQMRNHLATGLPETISSYLSNIQTASRATQALIKAIDKIL